MTCARHVERNHKTQDHLWRCWGQPYAAIRESFMAKKDMEYLRKESTHTQSTLLLQKNEALIAWHEAHREKDEVCANAAAET